MRPDSIAASVPPGTLDPLEQIHRVPFDPIGRLLDRVGAAERIDGVRDAALRGDDLLRPERDRAPIPPSGAPAPRRARCSAATAFRPARPPAPAARRGRCCCRAAARSSVLPAVCVWKRSCCARGSVAPNRSRMMTRPQPPRRAELGDLLEKVVVRVEEERQPLAEPVDVEPGVERRLHVGERIRERERDFLDRRRSRLADVIAADRDRVPVRQLPIAVGEDVGDDPQRRARRIDVGPARDVFLEDVVLDRAGQRRQRRRPACARPRRRARAG